VVCTSPRLSLLSNVPKAGIALKKDKKRSRCSRLEKQQWETVMVRIMGLFWVR